MSVATLDEAFDATCGDMLLKQRFCAAWEHVRSLALSLAAAFDAQLHVKLGDLCILEWGPAVNGKSSKPPAHRPARQVVEVHGIGSLAFSLHSSSADKTLKLERSLRDLSKLCQFAFDHSIKFQSMANSMAHDMTILLTGTGLALRALDVALTEVEATAPEAQGLGAARVASDQVLAEAQLGLYLVRNYMSHTNSGANPTHLRSRVNLNEALEDLRALHARVAAGKGVIIEPATGAELPTIDGDPGELRRALHNLFSNAVKYSYRSGPRAQRTVRVERIQNYDPKGHSGAQRCAIALSNYGLGVDEDETSSVFRSGFRGRQAVAQVATGTGIGLAEAQKIANAHSGKVTFKSKAVHSDELGENTYLTKVTLVLPYRRK